jgi:hypothetical protein
MNVMDEAEALRIARGEQDAGPSGVYLGMAAGTLAHHLQQARAEHLRTIEDTLRVRGEFDRRGTELAQLRARLRTADLQVSGLTTIAARALTEIVRLRAEVADYAARVTTGGPVAPITRNWKAG